VLLLLGVLPALLFVLALFLAGLTALVLDQHPLLSACRSSRSRSNAASRNTETARVIEAISSLAPIFGSLSSVSPDDSRRYCRRSRSEASPARST